MAAGVASGGSADSETYKEARTWLLLPSWVILVCLSLIPVGMMLIYSFLTKEFRGGVITANYTFTPQGKFKGTIQLRLSSDGSSLIGTWESHLGGGSGDYSAYRVRRVNKSALVEHLRDRFGDLVDIVE